MELECSINLKVAPFAGLHSDKFRIADAMPERSPKTEWHCNVEDGPYYYKTDYFEQIWDDVVYAVHNCLIAELSKMTLNVFLSLLIKRDKMSIFKPFSIIDFNDAYYHCLPEAAVFGLGKFKQGDYEEGLIYLEFARKKYALYIEIIPEDDSRVLAEKYVLQQFQVE